MTIVKEELVIKNGATFLSIVINLSHEDELIPSGEIKLAIPSFLYVEEEGAKIKLKMFVDDEIDINWLRAVAHELETFAFYFIDRGEIVIYPSQKRANIEGMEIEDIMKDVIIEI